MSRPVRRVAEIGWRLLLLGAIGALVLAAIATAAGSDGMSHTLGTVAWAASLFGSSLALAVGVGRKAHS